MRVDRRTFLGAIAAALAALGLPVVGEPQEIENVINVADSTRLAENYVLLNTRTREHILITAVDYEQGSITVLRGIGSDAYPMEAGDGLVIVHEKTPQGYPRLAKVTRG